MLPDVIEWTQTDWCSVSAGPLSCLEGFEDLGYYNGSVSHTDSGSPCLKWTDFPDYMRQYPGQGLGDHNLCRNPDQEVSPWCFFRQSSGAISWAYCDCHQGKLRGSCQERGVEPVVSEVNRAQQLNVAFEFWVFSYYSWPHIFTPSLPEDRKNHSHIYIPILPVICRCSQIGGGFIRHQWAPGGLHEWPVGGSMWYTLDEPWRQRHMQTVGTGVWSASHTHTCTYWYFRFGLMF